MVQGTDFLILAVITGATNVIGRSLGYLLWRHVRFLVLQSTVTIIIILSYGVILTKPGLIAGSLLLGVAKLCYSVQAVEVAVLHFDYDYYGISGFELGSGVSAASGMFGAMVGTSLAAFLDPNVAVLVTLVIACIELFVICLMKERF